MTTVVTDVGGGKLLTFVYDPAWVIMFDNAVIAWTVDETGATGPLPVVVGTLPPVTGDTAPIASPQWAQFLDGMVFVPDLLRTSPAGLFEFLATNNGANRKLFSQFTDPSLETQWRQWAGANSDLALDENPALPPPARVAGAGISWPQFAEPHRQVMPDGVWGRPLVEPRHPIADAGTEAETKRSAADPRHDKETRSEAERGTTVGGAASHAGGTTVGGAASHPAADTKAGSQAQQQRK